MDAGADLVFVVCTLENCCNVCDKSLLVEKSVKIQKKKTSSAFASEDLKKVRIPRKEAELFPDA